jgi:uncharacterized protein
VASRRFDLPERVVRIGVTGLAKSGKTSLLTSLAANLLAAGGGLPTLPALSTRLAGRALSVRVAGSGADPMPRFDHAAHLAALAADPPRWPDRTDAVSLLALELRIGRGGIAGTLPPRRVRLEFLDYPGEWLLDLPLLGQDFAAWSQAVLLRLEKQPLAREFLAFARGLPGHAAADEDLARAGHALYVETLRRLRQEAGLSLLQPGRFLMPAPGPAPGYSAFFPALGAGGLASLLRSRYDKYRDAVRREVLAPSFGRVERLVVLADVLTALASGPAAFQDAASALGAVAGSLRWRRFPRFLPVLLARRLPMLRGIGRVAFAATKADHVADRQRGNLASLVTRLAALPGGDRAEHAMAGFAIAAVRCTEDIVWSLDGRPVSAVRGREAGQSHAARSYPGEVPDKPPDESFWTHRFLSLPDFEPARLPLGGRAGVPHIGLDTLLVFLLEDLL